MMPFLFKKLLITNRFSKPSRQPLAKLSLLPKAKYVLLACLSLTVLSACDKKAGQLDSNNENALSFQCLENQSSCHETLDVGDFSVTFSQAKLIAELPFILKVDAKTNEKVVSITGFMEGKDMFMGKVPVIFGQPHVLENIQATEFKFQTSYTAETMVAACVEPEMRWIVWLTVITENLNGEQLKRSFPIEFDAYRD